jgi:membrane protein YdbS with pleckstrin-like domain
MSFINTELDLRSLPLAEEVQLNPVHQSYLKLLRIEWLITSAFLCSTVAALIFFIPEIRYTIWAFILLVVALLIIFPYYFLLQKSFPYMAFAVRDHDVIYQRGWLIRSVKVCPFNRIQNCSIQSGPLERKWKLASLTLYTAGTSGGDMRIPGLMQDEAERLRQYILSKINGAGATGV